MRYKIKNTMASKGEDPKVGDVFISWPGKFQSTYYVLVAITTFRAFFGVGRCVNETKCHLASIDSNGYLVNFIKTTKIDLDNRYKVGVCEDLVQMSFDTTIANSACCGE